MYRVRIKKKAINSQYGDIFLTIFLVTLIYRTKLIYKSHLCVWEIQKVNNHQYRGKIKGKVTSSV